uniref:Uncharacterized protein n=1 Tax=Rhizophora mucronata TaxID=61149 RepID=A0A2P2PDJ0_RHIMU
MVNIILYLSCRCLWNSWFYFTIPTLLGYEC